MKKFKPYLSPSQLCADTHPHTRVRTHTHTDSLITEMLKLHGFPERHTGGLAATTTVVGKS